MDAPRPTIDEYLMMTPEQRQQSLRDRMARDLSQVDPEFLEKAKADLRWALDQRALDAQA